MEALPLPAPRRFLLKPRPHCDVGHMELDSARNATPLSLHTQDNCNSPTPFDIIRRVFCIGFIFIFLKVVENIRSLCVVIFGELQLAEEIVSPVQRFHLCISAKVFEFIWCIINKTRIKRHYHF